MNRFLSFFKDVFRELKKVKWPNRRELTTYTTVVVIAVVLVAAIIWVVDTGYTKVLQLIF
ncbi:MAG: preprotein translocase subunit SecE [Bacillota bacterium]|jgi:preprotein translocase subunit SecE